jgi:hypothetical protein
MKSQIALAALALSCTFVVAQEPARKPCEDLKADITKKLEAKGVTSYTLDVVDKGKEAADAKVVGSCDGGTKSIVYTRGAAGAETKTADAKKPQ